MTSVVGGDRQALEPGRQRVDRLRLGRRLAGLRLWLARRLVATRGGDAAVGWAEVGWLVSSATLSARRALCPISREAIYRRTSAASRPCRRLRRSRS